MTYVAHDESDFVPPMEVEEPELYHPKTFIGKYIWSQDAKVIAVCMVLLAAIYLMSNDPAFKPDPAALRAATRPAPSPVVWRMPGVSR